ncbi:MAG: hypothetical protein NVS3B28_10110 [Candidatus Velthaea sp.]
MLQMERLAVRALVEDLQRCTGLDPRDAAPSLERHCERLRSALDFPAIALPGTYRRTMLHRCKRFELLLLDWGAASASSIHDHGGQNCTVIVLDGSVSIEDYVYDCSGTAPRLEHVRTRDDVGIGSLDGRRDDRSAIHRVCSPAGARTLHVYSEPIEHCGAYDPQTHLRSVRTLHYDAVDFVAARA